MKRKIIKFFGVTVFSAAALFLFGSVPSSAKQAQSIDYKEFSHINNDAEAQIPDDFCTIIQKNPAILLEIAVD